MIDIHSRRVQLGLTLQDVGKLCGVGKSTVRKWECGMIENMKRDKIALLATALRVNPVDLLSFPDQKEEQIAISVTAQQHDLLIRYRKLNESQKELICSMLGVLRAPGGKSSTQSLEA